MSFLTNYTSFWRRHFPQSKAKASAYARIFLPIMIGSICFALNGVVDNFMVGHINQGQTALGAINLWTTILMGFFLGTSAGGSVVLAQFYHAKKYAIVKEVARYRFYLCFIPALVLALIAWTSPDTLAKVWIKKGSDTYAYNLILENCRRYTKVIAFQWLLIAFSFNYGNQLRELGYGKFSMMWGFASLFTNVLINAILLYVVGMGVEGAAWASAAARLVSAFSGFLVVKLKKIEIGFKPWSIFQVSWATRKLIWKRWPYILSIFTVMFFVTFRTFFYSRGYLANDDLGKGVSGLSVVALAGALMNIFTTTFSALASMAANFVASELGKGQVKQAKSNADELKGFMTLVALILSIMLMIFAAFIPFMTFLARTKYDSNHHLTFDGQAQLKQVSYALYVICFFYPIWIWFSSSYRLGSSGGKGGKFAFVDWIVTASQLLWLAAIMFLIVPTSSFMQHYFWTAYALFFLSDLLKLWGQEYFYYKYDWLNVLTKSEVENKKVMATDFVQGNAELPSEK